MLRSRKRGSALDAILAALGLAVATTGPTSAADSLGWRGPLRAEGGEVLSTREIRRELPFEGTRPLTTPEIEAALVRLGARLIAEGRYEATLQLSPEPSGGVVLRVDDGPTARWDSLQTPADLRLRPDRTTAAPRRGDRFDPDRLEAVLEGWVAAAVEEGYPFAAARLESLKVEAGRVWAGARLDRGPFCRVEEVEFAGLRSTRPEFLRRWLRYRPGRPYRESLWAEAAPRLERTGLFLTAGEPEVAYLGEGRARVRLPVEEAKHNRIEGAVGYAGRTKDLSGFVDLVLGNLFGTGRSFAFRWDRRREEQAQLRLSWREPLLGPWPVGSVVTLEQEDQDSTYSRLVLDGRLDAILGRDLTIYTGVEYHRSLLGVEPAERIRRVSTLAGMRWETLRPGQWRGRLLEVSARTGQGRVRPAGGGASRKVRLERGTISIEEARDLSSGLAVRLRLRADAIGRNDPLPASDALRLGGAESVRGYEAEAFAARRFAAAQLEVGPVFAGGQAYLFMDGARWRTLPVPGQDRDAVGFGAGVRSESADRSVAVDVGVPRGGGVGEARLHLRLLSRF